MTTFKGWLTPQGDAQIDLGLIGVQNSINVTIDTGFDGTLMLPKKLIARSNAQYLVQTDVVLASGRRSLTDVYLVQIYFLGQVLFVPVLIGKSHLLGTKLLTQTRLTIDYLNDMVMIEK